MVAVIDPFRRHTATVVLTAFMERGQDNTLNQVHRGYGRIVIGVTRGLAVLILPMTG